MLCFFLHREGGTVPRRNPAVLAVRRLRSEFLPKLRRWGPLWANTFPIATTLKSIPTATTTTSTAGMAATSTLGKTVVTTPKAATDRMTFIWVRA